VKTRYNCYDCGELFFTESSKMVMNRPICPKCRSVKLRSTNSETKLESLEDRVHSLEKLSNINYEAVMYEVKDKIQEICKDVINEYTKAFDEKLMKIHGSVATLNTRILKLQEENNHE
tara:strand:+ start:116 stop:469 length:354 start_codon:yes stop_codon:yes gene_type:complete